jgi:hypothetical protein
MIREDSGELDVRLTVFVHTGFVIFCFSLSYGV